MPGDERLQKKPQDAWDLVCVCVGGPHKAVCRTGAWLRRWADLKCSRNNVEQAEWYHLGTAAHGAFMVLYGSPLNWMA